MGGSDGATVTIRNPGSHPLIIERITIMEPADALICEGTVGANRGTFTRQFEIKRNFARNWAHPNGSVPDMPGAMGSAQVEMTIQMPQVREKTHITIGVRVRTDSQARRIYDLTTSQFMIPIE